MHIRPADAARRRAALKVLFSKFPSSEQEERLSDALSAADRGTLDLSGLWIAEENGEAIGATLIMPQADGVMLVWPPVAQNGARKTAAEIQSALMRAILPELNRRDVTFGQCLLSAEETDEADLAQQFGFEKTAELFFLARGLEEPWPIVTEPRAVEIEQFDEARNFDQFAAVIERTYVDSLDCPRLNGTRNGADAIAGHRLSGEFRSKGWRLYRIADQDAAVLLLNEHPDQDAVELVYFGVAPEFRGKGWGRRLISDALSAAKGWNRAAIFLAVDAANNPANAIYAEFGFQELTRREVWLRFPDDQIAE
jgi:ribosomal protein S18 acetylase RimI-like enzyme